MDVSIIIVTYNTCKMTNECINSIVQYTIGLEYEIILVDNASQDDSYNTFSHDERVHYIYNDKNLGFGKANNVGAKHATGRYLFLLNSDTLLKNNAIGYFVEFMDSSPQNIGCCGTLLTDAKGGRMHSFGDAHTIFNTLDEWCVFPVLSHIGLRNQLSKYYCRTIPDIYFLKLVLLLVQICLLGVKLMRNAVCLTLISLCIMKMQNFAPVTESMALKVL